MKNEEGGEEGRVEGEGRERGTKRTGIKVRVRGGRGRGEGADSASIRKKNMNDEHD